jgi:hypothetical protein
MCAPQGVPKFVREDVSATEGSKVHSHESGVDVSVKREGRQISFAHQASACHDANHISAKLFPGLMDSGVLTVDLSKII